MRDKINQAVKGVFEYDTANIVLSLEELSIEVNAGEDISGTFTVTNDASRFMRGEAISDCHFMEFPEEFFQGVTNEVAYVFYANELRPGVNIKGNITLITDCGTKLLPFTVFVGVPSCEASGGKIKDLFHFTNLAKEKPEEAAALFRNEHFEEVFLYRDNKNIALYRGLSKGTSRGLALEEFLIAIHKKLPVGLSVDKNSFQYNNCKNSFSDQFVLTKNNWGYGEYHITSDSAFIVPNHKLLWTDNFMGNTYPVQFLVDTDQMTPGKNYARITVSDARQKIEITILATKERESHNEILGRRKEHRHLYKLNRLHLDFCMGNISSEVYLNEIGNIIYAMEGNSGATEFTQLFKIHLGIMQHKEASVKSGLSLLEAKEESLRKENSTFFCAYQYLKGLWADEDEVVLECVREIGVFYKKEPENFMLLWFLLYLSPNYQTDERKYDAILGQLGRGCHSPLIFMELCSILNENPDYLFELNPGICEAIHWGAKEKYIEKELAMRFCYLAGRMKYYSKFVVRDLCGFYELYEEEEILTSICKLLMKGQITSAAAFHWYHLGVEHNLKLTDLYEYYMYSIDESQEMELKDNTLLYFMYDNHLTVSKKAMLYAYVVRNKHRMQETYDSYRQMMQDFTLRQLSAGKITENLAILYEEFISEESINETIAGQLPVVMFSHEILCENPDIIGVYVTHRELQGEEYVPFIKGRAVVQIFTETDEIFLADRMDNRYAASIAYTDNKLLHLDHLAEKCFEYHCEHPHLLLYLYDRAERMNRQGENIVEVKKKVLEIPNLSRYHYRKSFSSLVRFYYDNFEGELLDAILEHLNWDMVSPSERQQFIEYCAVRRFFDKAMEGIERYGYEKIDGKRLLKVSTETFQAFASEENTQLVKLGWHIYETGNFDENIMRYLCRYYSGRINEMTGIWRYANGFQIETDNFAERILGQVIFTEEMTSDVYEVFYQYYEIGKDKYLILAFMKFIAYKYLIHGWILPSRMFDYFYKEVQVQENLFCLIAVLKFLSQKPGPSEEEIAFADYHLNKLYEKKIIFPFFRDFYGKLTLPIHILDEYYVEYIANPDYEVRIHYLISSGYEKGEYRTETMRDVFQGIHVKEFVLFQDEILQYYISEVRPEGEVITKSVSVNFDETMDKERTSSRYHMLNLMMIAQEMNEETTLAEMMKEYVEQQESVQILFQPLE
ncbi:MAG: hypothetical protein IJ733_07340 [Lachnospiraceae bacterium]|nr:hypothetical protein [Lachnospiraceae bacterium]